MLTPDRVTRARDAAGKTQQELADLIGVHLATITDYENGRRPGLRKGRTKLEEFVATWLPAADPPAVDVDQVLRSATDLQLISALAARLDELRSRSGTASTGNPADDRALDQLAAQGPDGLSAQSG